MDKELERQQGNLVFNPGFERDWGWVYFDETPAGFDRQTVHGGQRSVRIAGSQHGITTRPLMIGVPRPNKPINLIPVGPKSRYVVRVWVHGQADLTCALFNKDLKFLGYRPIQQGGVEGRWQPLSGELVDLDPPAAYFGVEVCARQGQVYVDDASVYCP